MKAIKMIQGETKQNIEAEHLKDYISCNSEEKNTQLLNTEAQKWL